MTNLDPRREGGGRPQPHTTWIRRHCIECWHDIEHCATCGCHDHDPNNVAPQRETDK